MVEVNRLPLFLAQVNVTNHFFTEQLMEQGAVKRSGQGRPRIRPLRLVGDKGYTGRRIRSYLRRRGIRLTIPRLDNEPRRGPFNR